MRQLHVAHQTLVRFPLRGAQLEQRFQAPRDAQ